MLVLFDIDGTLLRSRGIGIQSMEGALEALHGVPVDASTVDVGGRMDPHLFREISESHGLPIDDEALQALRDEYVRRMQIAFKDQTWSYAMPGAVDAVHAAHQHPEITSAILTGNIEPTSWIKLADAGFERSWFSFGVFGDEAETRRGLPPLAHSRYQDLFGHQIQPSETIVIGDTPKDVDCAHNAGCRAIAVATGMSSIDDLRATGADLVIDSLEDTAMVIEWIVTA